VISFLGQQVSFSLPLVEAEHLQIRNLVPPSVYLLRLGLGFLVIFLDDRIQIRDGVSEVLTHATFCFSGVSFSD